MHKNYLKPINNSDAPITNQQFEGLIQIQQNFMAKITLGGNHQKTLDDLCHSIETLLPNVTASILLFDQTGRHLNVRSAPSIPASGIKLLDELTRKEKAELYGSCLYKNKPYFFCNTALNVPWPNSRLQEFSKEFNIATCWAMPLLGKNHQLLGTFVLTSMKKQIPYTYHKKILEICTNIASAVLQHEKKELQLWHLAHHDQLTGLPNRRLFNLSLEHAIKKSNRAINHIGICLIDLDHFKNINDTLGHEYGDIALQEASKRIQQCIRDEDTLSRLGGDEFVLITENIIKPLSVYKIAEKIHKSLAKPFILNGYSYKLTASIGISFYPRDGKDNQSLLKSADTAMYEAKNQGRGRSIYYKPGLASLL